MYPSSASSLYDPGSCAVRNAPAALYGVRMSMIGSGAAMDFGTSATANSFTPSRTGIVSSRRSKASCGCSDAIGTSAQAAARSGRANRERILRTLCLRGKGTPRRYAVQRACAVQPAGYSTFRTTLARLFLDGVAGRVCRRVRGSQAVQVTESLAPRDAVLFRARAHRGVPVERQDVGSEFRRHFPELVARDGMQQVIEGAVGTRVLA